MVSNFLYCRPTDDKAGPCSTHDLDRRLTCLLELQHKQETTCSLQVKHQQHFRCTITRGYCGKRRPCEEECNINHRVSEKHKNPEEERSKQGCKGKPDGGGSRVVRVTVVRDGAPQPPPPP